MQTLLTIIYLSGIGPAFVLFNSFDIYYCKTNRTEQPSFWFVILLTITWPIILTLYLIVLCIDYYFNYKHN